MNHVIVNFFSFNEYIVINALIKNEINEFDSDFFINILKIDEKIGHRICQGMLKQSVLVHSSNNNNKTKYLFSHENFKQFIKKKIDSVHDQIRTRESNIIAAYNPDQFYVTCAQCKSNNEFTLSDYGICKWCNKDIHEFNNHFISTETKVINHRFYQIYNLRSSFLPC